MREPRPPADKIDQAEAFRAAIAGLDAFLDALPASEHRRSAKQHLAAFAFSAGLAAGLELRGETIQ